MSCMLRKIHPLEADKIQLLPVDMDLILDLWKVSHGRWILYGLDYGFEYGTGPGLGHDPWFWWAMAYVFSHGVDPWYDIAEYFGARTRSIQSPSLQIIYNQIFYMIDIRYGLEIGRISITPAP